MKPCYYTQFILLTFALTVGQLPSPDSACAQGVHISIETSGNGDRSFQFASEPTNYYALYRGNAITDVTNPIQVVFATPPTNVILDGTSQLPASFYRVLTVPTNAPLDLDSDGVDDVAELLAGTDPLQAPGGLVINEVDYDQIGTDTMEFVEILNASTSAVSLSGLRLILMNGANNTQYLSADLSLAGPTLAAGQYLVVKAAALVIGPGPLTIDFAAAQDNVQNGAPDAVAIFDLNSNQIIDALSYEGSVTAGVITGVPGTFNFVEGTALSGSVLDSNTVAGSLGRSPNGMDTDDAATDWAFSTTPTPGAVNAP